MKGTDPTPAGRRAWCSGSGTMRTVDSSERPHFERLDEPNRWALANRGFLALIWAKFVADEDWPNGRFLQRELFGKGRQFDLAEFSLRMPPMFGRVEPSTGKIHLTPRGLSFVLAARPVLDAMADLVRIAVERYADTDGEPVINSAEFEGLLGIDPGRARLLTFILLEDHWLFRAAGGAVNEGQRFQVDERAVLRVNDVHAIEEYLDAQAATWYPDTSKPDVRQPTPALTAGQDRGAPAAPLGPSPARRRPSWWKRHRTDVGVIATVCGVAAAIVIPLVVTGGGGSSAGVGSSPSSTPGAPPPSSSIPKIAEQDGLKPRREVADVRKGIVVYTDNLGTRAKAIDIPIGKRVVVVCHAPNYSGSGTINAFYLIATPPWRGLFASANQFANGAPVGVTTDASPIDPEVHACRL